MSPLESGILSLIAIAFGILLGAVAFVWGGSTLVRELFLYQWGDFENAPLWLVILLMIVGGGCLAIYLLGVSL